MTYICVVTALGLFFLYCILKSGHDDFTDINDDDYHPFV